MAKLQDKVVVVTGGGSGIGAEIAALAAEEGAQVLLADVDQAAAAAVADRIRGTGGVAEWCHLDLSNEESIKEMFKTVISRFGAMSAIVNNASKTSLTAFDHGIETMDLRIWDETMQVNLRGTMLACKYAVPVFRSGGGGAIVNIASGAALKGARGLSAYAVSKAGVITLGEYIAAQHGQEGIRCNTIAPGIILTQKTAEAFGSPSAQAKVLPFHLSKRLGVPRDIAWTVLWLIADEGAYVNGQTISVDGGLLAHQNYMAEAMAIDA